MYPLKKGKVAQQAHVGVPEGTYEEEHGRKGFYGKSAHLYHAHPPTGWIRFEGKLRPHLFDLNKLTPSDCHEAEGMPVAFLGNDDLRLYVSRRSQPMPFYYRNADGDELIFVHRGNGTIETDFGPLRFERGDYLVVPRAVTYRILPESQDNFFLIVQSSTEFEQPDKGLVGHHALYDPGVIITPEPAPYLDDHREWEVRIKVEDEISKVVYPFNPLDVVGWKGDLTVWKINMRDIRPIMSHRAHLPPSAHTTFVTAARWSAASCRARSSRTPKRCASHSSTATPITTSSSSTTTAIFSAKTTSRPATPRCTRAASTTGRIRRRWPTSPRRPRPTSTP
jgi:homogentisate 1,2-dioxygenase